MDKRWTALLVVLACLLVGQTARGWIGTGDRVAEHAATGGACEGRSFVSAQTGLSCSGGYAPVSPRSCCLSSPNPEPLSVHSEKHSPAMKKTVSKHRLAKSPAEHATAIHEFSSAVAQARLLPLCSMSDSALRAIRTVVLLT